MKSFTETAFEYTHTTPLPNKIHLYNTNGEKKVTMNTTGGVSHKILFVPQDLSLKISQREIACMPEIESLLGCKIEFFHFSKNNTVFFDVNGLINGRKINERILSSTGFCVLGDAVLAGTEESEKGVFTLCDIPGELLEQFNLSDF